LSIRDRGEQKEAGSSPAQSPHKHQSGVAAALGPISNLSNDVQLRSAEHLRACHSGTRLPTLGRRLH
jgi:hypothetical protein